MMWRGIRGVLVGIGWIVALATLVPTGTALLSMLEHPGHSTFRLFSYQNLPDGPRIAAVVFARWPGLLIAAAALLGVPAAIAVTLFRGPRLLLRRGAFLLLFLWLGWWAVGFGRLVVTFGEAADTWHFVGAAATLTGTLGMLVGLLTPRRGGGAARVPAIPESN